MVAIDGVALSQEALDRERSFFADLPDPDAAARRALAVRELILRRAGELGLLEDGAARDAVTFASRDEEDRMIEAVIDADVQAPVASEAECRRHFDMHPERFEEGELIEARHILFAVVPGTPVAALRAEAERVLGEILRDPSCFAERAQKLSNCPSGAQGGNLGQFARGQMAPEFERAIFGKPDVGLLPQLVNTRYGFHIVEVVRRIAGRRAEFGRVREAIAARLDASAQARALRQYVQVLAGRVRLEGVDLDAAQSPLLQ